MPPHCRVTDATTGFLNPPQQHRLVAMVLMALQLTGGYFILVCIFGKQEFRLRGSCYFLIQTPEAPPVPRKAWLSSERSSAAQAFPWPQPRLVLPQVLQSRLCSCSSAGICCESQETRDGKFINTLWKVYGKRL